MCRVIRRCENWAVCLLVLLATATAAPAQTFNSLYSFNYSDGGFPQAGLIQATDGNLYGTTPYGGANYNELCGGGGCGTIFKITPTGTLTTLYNFCAQPNCTDGAYPYGGLIEGADGDLYGTTGGGGANNSSGTVFKLTLTGKLSTLYNFCSQSNCTDGSDPAVPLLQAPDGNFYGTTDGGGRGYGYGTIFKIAPKGTLTTLYSFCAQRDCTDGELPYSGLALGTDGNLYGTTLWGGTVNEGTVFKMTTAGFLTTLYSFCIRTGCTDGFEPGAGPLVEVDGDFYGTTQGGGLYDGGTVFQITLKGAFSTLYSFCAQTNCIDGDSPYAGLLRANDGNFYGTTEYGGMNTGLGDGTAFKITRKGTLTTLHSFDGSDGYIPWAGLFQATNGVFCVTTQLGGSNGSCSYNYGCGTVFSLSVGLPGFVETLPISGKVGKPVKILGTDLTGTTSVTFNGTPATFAVVSPTLIATTVPAAATTGRVQVVTPGGTLSSNVPFRVIP